MSKKIKQGKTTMPQDPFGVKWRNNLNTTPSTIVIRYSENGAAIKIIEDGTGRTVQKMIRRYYKDEPNIRAAIEYAVESVLSETDAGYTGWLVCCESDFETFIPGKLYRMKDGVLSCEGGLYNPEGPYYRTVEQLNVIGGHKFIPFRGTEMHTLPKEETNAPRQD